MVLGSLIKGSVKIGLWPPALRPVFETSFRQLRNKIRSIEIVTICNPEPQTSDDSDLGIWGGKGSKGERHIRIDRDIWNAVPEDCCDNVKQNIHTSLIDIEKSLCGLHLEDFGASN
jgi:hypothetical protein